jgi:hypothetical protein
VQIFSLWKFLFLHVWSRASRNINLHVVKKAVSDSSVYMPRRPFSELSLYKCIFMCKYFTLWIYLFVHIWSRASRNINLHDCKKAVSDSYDYMPIISYAELSQYINIYIYIYVQIFYLMKISLSTCLKQSIQEHKFTWR